MLIGKVLNLLKETGVIFITIDDNEAHHLRMILNEVFDGMVHNRLTL